MEVGVVLRAVPMVGALLGKQAGLLAVPGLLTVPRAVTSIVAARISSE